MVDINECWLFAGYKNSIGYGQIFYTVNGKSHYQYAHRVSYETFKAQIPKGLVIDHLCSVRHCINPNHLEAVTARENTLRGDGVQVNIRKTRCPKGHDYSMSNTQYFGKKRWRRCRQCAVARHQEYRIAMKQSETTKEGGKQSDSI